jgi:hypothetical protein
MKRGAHRLAWIQDKDILVSTHLVPSRRGSHAHVPINQSEKEIVGLLCYAERPAAQQTALLMIVVRILSKVHVMRALLVPGQSQKLPFYFD